MLNLQLSQSDHEPLRILCLGAHSDDIEIGCGGTLLELLERHPQAVVEWVVFSGAGARAQEAAESAAVFLARAGRRTVVVKDFRDGYFPEQYAGLKDEFEMLKRRFAPDVVFTHFRHDRHQDHRIVSDLTWNTFRNHLILEYEIPKYDGDLGQPNLFVPLTPSLCEAKVSNLLAGFPTQRDKAWFDRETFFAILRLRGVEANSPTRYAEAFHCRKLILR